MGAAVSTGRNNDELIDNLLEAGYIKSPLIERVFRAVDRADYFLPEARSGAYKDVAWKSGNFHISAPCIYSEVMEGLRLKEGLSFLNLGSGTGYLSTMIGLILGPYGINHGIELHKDVIEYANEKLECFKKLSHAVDEYEFCEPHFIEGNCLCLNSEVRQYDRVYCGAACPEQHENYMKNLIKVGGILVMPVNDRLIQVSRTSDTNWDIVSLLPVSFASLILPPEMERQNMFKMLDSEPLSLQATCRVIIRTILRRNVEIEHPEVKQNIRRQPKRPRKKRTLRRFVLPIFEESGDESSETGPAGRDLGRVRFDSSLQPELMEDSGDIISNSREMNSFIDVLLGYSTEFRQAQNSNEENSSTNNGVHNESTSNTSGNVETSSEDSSTSDTEKDSDGEEDKLDKNSYKHKRKDILKRKKFDSGIGDEDVSNDKTLSSDSEVEETNKKMEVDCDSDTSADSGPTYKRQPWYTSTRNGCKLKRVSLSSQHCLESESDSGSSQEQPVDLELNEENVPYVSPYTAYMHNKILALPLPNVLQSYVNFYRDF